VTAVVTDKRGRKMKKFDVNVGFFPHHIPPFVVTVQSISYRSPRAITSSRLRLASTASISLVLLSTIAALLLALAPWTTTQSLL
jgi:hypothetical protein